MKRGLLAIGLALLMSACASYTTPGAGVALGAIAEADTDIADAFQRRASAVFPARIAVVRVAAPGYYSGTNQSMGSGRFSVVTARDIETEDSFARLGRMPRVAGVAPISRLLLPAQLTSIRDLRTSAAQLQTDVLLVYTIDTQFRTENTSLGPLQTISLGFLPTKKAIVSATCAFMLVDVRTGFIYGAGERTATQDQRSNLWDSRDAIEAARIRAERQAFEDGLGEIETLWTSVLAQHQPAAG